MTKITADASLLAKVLGDVKDVAKRDTGTPIIGNVLVRISAGTLSAIATDHELEIVRSVPLDQPDCAFCVDARRFSGIVSAMPAGAQIAITVGDGHISVVGGRSRFRLGTLNPEAFPRLPFKADPTLEAKADFFEALSLASGSVAAAGTAQYWLAGIFIGDRDGRGRIAGTDGNRLIAVELDPMGAEEAILTQSVVNTAAKFGKECAIAFDDMKVRFDFGDTVITAKLIDGTYPQFARVIPVTTQIKVEFEGDDLVAALNRISLVADDKDRTVKVEFAADRMTVSNRSNVDQGSEEVPCAFVGEPFEAAFRLAYLRDAIEALDGDVLEWGLNDEMAPTKLVNPKRPAVVAVVMPTR